MPDSSTEPVSTEGAQAPDVQDVNTTDSSSADQSGSMLDAVMAAIDPDKEKSLISAPDSAKAAEPQSTEGAKAPKAGDPDLEDLTQVEIDKLHHKTRKQINKLIGQRKDLENHVSLLRPKAEQLDQITDQIQRTGLDGADLNNLLEIGSLMKKGDLFAARDKLMPYVQAIVEATGGVLPKDLEDAIKAGQLSEQHARELAEARSRTVLNQHQSTVQEQERGQVAAHQFLGQVVNSVNEWEQGKRRSDPDWSLKAPEIRAALELAILKGAQPKSPQEAIQMAEKALIEVDAKLKQFRPPPRAVHSVSGSPQASRAAVEPKSMLEAISKSLAG